jgi:hypothetical protein
LYLAICSRLVQLRARHSSSRGAGRPRADWTTSSSPAPPMGARIARVLDSRGRSDRPLEGSNLKTWKPENQRPGVDAVRTSGSETDCDKMWVRHFLMATSQPLAHKGGLRHPAASARTTGGARSTSPPAPFRQAGLLFTAVCAVAWCRQLDPLSHVRSGPRDEEDGEYSFRAASRAASRAARRRDGCGIFVVGQVAPSQLTHIDRWRTRHYPR